MLNENLKALRAARGLSQQQLAQRLHVVRQTVAKWEKGLSVPDADLLVRLAQELGTTVPALLDGQNAAAPPETPALLAALNEQFAQQARQKRRVWHAVFLVLCILTGLTVAAVLLVLGMALPQFLHYQKIAAQAGTALPLSSWPALVFQLLWLAALIVPFIACLVGFIKTRPR